MGFGLICRVEVVERSKIAFGKSDPRTVRYMELLARDYYNGLSYAKARQVQEQVVKERSQTYGQSHEETVESRVSWTYSKCWKVSWNYQLGNT